jgi:hypothetical protein
MTDTTTKTEAVNVATRWLGPDGFKRLAQFFEMLSVIALTSLLGVFWLASPKGFPLPIPVAAALIIIVAFASLALAVFCSFSAEEASRSAQQNADTQMHIISEARLSVLKDMSVPEGVRSFLRSLISDPQVGKKLLDGSKKNFLFISGGELVSALNDGLGPEVSRRFKGRVLEYTLCDEKQAAVLAEKDGVQMALP